MENDTNALFERALAITLGEEGGLSNVAGDAGGLTLSGVTQATYDEYRDTVGKPRQSVTLSTADERVDVYRVMCWQRGRCDRMPAPVCLVHFDAVVNHGPGGAALLLQAVLDVEMDGAIGDVTFRAIAVQNAVTLAHDLLMARRGLFVGLELANSSQRKFEDGWQNRVDHLAKKVQV